MDEAASALRLEAIEQGLLGPEAVSDLERELAEIQAEKEASALAEDYERAAKLRQREMQVMLVTPADIARVVEVWTGVPVTQLVEGERANLIHLEDDLRTRVVGQNEAINAV